MYRLDGACGVSEPIAQFGGPEVISDTIISLLTENKSVKIMLKLKGSRGEKDREYSIRITRFYKRRGRLRATMSLMEGKKPSRK